MSKNGSSYASSITQVMLKLRHAHMNENFKFAKKFPENYNLDIFGKLNMNQEFISTKFSILNLTLDSQVYFSARTPVFVHCSELVQTTMFYLERRI